MLNFDHCVKIQNYWLTYCFQSCASLWRQISILKDSLDLQTRPEKIKKEGYESSDVDFDGLYPQYEASLRFFRWNTHQDMRCPAPRWDVFEFSLLMIIIMVCSWPSFSFMSKTHSGRNVQFTYENPKIGLEKIEKCFKFPKPRQKFILLSWYWNSFKNTLPIESKIFRKVFEIQANKKVGILRRNDKSSQMNNSKAPQYYDVGFEKHCLTCAFSKRRSFLMVKFQSRTFPFHFTSLYCRTQLESCLKLFLMGLNQLEGCLRRISGFFVLSIFSPK